MVLESSLINVLHPNPSFSMTWVLRVNFLAHIGDIYEYGWDIYECIWDIYEERWLYCPHQAGSALLPKNLGSLPHSTRKCWGDLLLCALALPRDYQC